MIKTKEQTVLKINKRCIRRRRYAKTQYSVLGYRIDLYFYKYKLGIEVDELEHGDRNLGNEIERQKALDKKNFNIFKEINKIHRYIKKSTKKPLINDLKKIARIRI